ncbi:MAG TPA: hypothetical protein VOA41_14410 [Candidatus Dormibacteraeota bacterium]|nr:hypothetical protein [Candidatus Dormibacteraeota bacterium]
MLRAIPCLFLGTSVLLGALPLRAQDEIVANLAAGRVVIDVAKDGIVIGAIEQHVEANSRPPIVFPINDRRIGVLLGAAEWVLPSSASKPVRLDQAISRLSREAAPHKEASKDDQASDIEAIGIAFLEKVRTMADQLHHKIDLSSDAPLVELLLIDYQSDYGPEVWLLQYRIKQERLRGDFWQTKTLRPSYTQLYPPEKHQPRTLVEVRYPPETPGPTVLELLQQNDPRLASARRAAPKSLKVIDNISNGKSSASSVEDSATFLHDVLDPLAGSDNRIVLGVLREERGWDWIVAPPELLEKAAEDKTRPPEAPTLRRKP